jgi:hypothetical protein
MRKNDETLFSHLVPSATLKTLMTVPLSLAVAILVPEGEN